jgi:hypothetical protein
MAPDRDRERDGLVAYHVYGTQWWTYDTATGQSILLGYTGTLTDICAALS